MDKMRSSTGPILWVLVVAFGVLFMLQDTQVFDAVMAGPRTLGEVEGRQITSEEYNQRVSAFTEQHRQQTGTPPSIEQNAYYRELVWDQMVVDLALKAEMEKLGIQVSDQEIVDAVFGDTPDPIIRQLFGRPDGSIDRATLRAVAEAPEAGPEWIIIENQIRERIAQEKINQYMMSAIKISDREIEQDFIRANSTLDLSYVRFPYSDISDDEISVSDSDIRTYYRNNPSQFKQDKTWRFRFVTFSKAPTAEDTVRSLDRIGEFRQDFAEAENDSLFLLYQLEAVNEYDNSFRTPEEVGDAFSQVFDIEIGEVTEPAINDDRVSVAKKTGERGDEVSFVEMSFMIEADPSLTVGYQESLADDFSVYADMEGFEKEAENNDYTIQEATATKGTPFISGLGESRVAMRWLETSRRGQVSEVIELDEVFIVIKVDEVREAGTRPLDEVSQQVETAVKNEKRKEVMVQRVRSEFASPASLEDVASSADRQVQNASNLRMNSTNISGAGREPGLVGAAFAASTGELKGPFTGDNAVFFFVVNERNDADMANLTDNERNRIKTRLQQSKNRVFTEKLVEQLREQANVKDHRQALNVQ